MYVNYSRLRLQGKLHGTIKRAKALRQKRDSLVCKPQNNVVAFMRTRSNPPANAVLLSVPSSQPPITKYKRAKHWTSTKASFSPTREISYRNGTYGGYPYYEYKQLVQSWGMIFGNKLYFRVDTKTGLRKGFLKLPRGYYWAKDDNGVCLKSNNGKFDYHPSATEIVEGNVINMIREAQRNYVLRQEKKVADKATQKLLKTISVTLEDCRAMGYCVQGTMAWVRAKLGEKIADRITEPLFSVPAELVWKSGDERAKRVVARAIERCTMVAI